MTNSELMCENLPMTKRTNRRVQTQKPRNEAFKRAMMEKGRSSATSPIPSGKQYRRPAPGTKWS